MEPIDEGLWLNCHSFPEDQEKSDDKTAEGEDDVVETPDLRSKAFAVGKNFVQVEYLEKFACLSIV